MGYNGLLGGVLSSWKQSIWIPRASKNMLQCAKYNQNTRGSGDAPQEIFEK